MAPKKPNYSPHAGFNQPAPTIVQTPILAKVPAYGGKKK